MTPLERLAFDRGMEAWAQSLKRKDMSENDRVRAALLAYQRQVFALDAVKQAEEEKNR